MAKSPARLNDPHECPLHGSGKIVTANSQVIFEGLPVACAGDKVECKEGSKTVIKTGQACVQVNGNRIALVGDETEHQGTLKNGANGIHVDEGDAFISIGTNVEVGANVFFCV